MTITKAYWEKSTPMREGLGDYFERRKFRYDLQDYMHDVFPFKTSRGLKILEIGSGSGIDACEFARYGARVTALDMTDDAVKLTSETAQEARTFVEVRQGDATNLPFETASFDIVYCTPADSIVSGDYIPIKEMKIGTPTFGLGGLGATIRTFEHHYEGDMYDISASGMLPVRLTPEHKLLVAKGEVFHRYKKIATREWGEPDWKKPTDINFGQERKDGVFHSKVRDYLVMPRMEGTVDKTWLDLSGFVLRDSRSISGLQRFGRSTSLPLDEDVMWMLGLYVAEGSSCKGHITFSLNEKEQSFMDRITRICSRLGYRTQKWHSKESKGAYIGVSSSLWARAFRQWFGTGARTKKIPDFILLHKRTDWLAAFLRGYEQGDGCETNELMSIGTVSKVLALQLQCAYARLGRYVKIYPCKLHDSNIRGRFRPKKAEHWYNLLYYTDGRENRSYVTGKYIYSQVRKVTKNHFDGMVYNIETTDSTYLISNATVHNCYGVLHHIPEVNPVIAEIYRVLVPNGQFMGMLYNKDSLLYHYSIIGLHNAEKLKPEQLSAKYSERNVGCPYTKCYTKWEAAALFKDFKETNVVVRYNVVDHPQQRKVKLNVDDKYELGWHLIVKATK